MIEGLLKVFFQLVQIFLQLTAKIFLVLLDLTRLYPFHFLGGFLLVIIAHFIWAGLTLSHLIFIFCGGVVIAILLKAKTFPFLGKNSDKKRIGSGQATARWSDETDMKSLNLFESEGLLLGKIAKRKGIISFSSKQKIQPDSTLLRFNQDFSSFEGNLLTVAPPGAGKGVGVVIPNLLTYPGSVIVTDPKGENYAVTALARRRMGQGVFCLDPFEICDKKNRAKLNPLDLLDPNEDDLIDDARTLADSLILRPKSEQGNDKYFNDEAVTLLTGLILYVVCELPEESRHLGEVRTLLTSPADELAFILNMMESSPYAHGIIARTASSFKQLPENTSASVLSTVKSNTGFLDSPRVVKSLSKSSFDIRDLKKRGDISIYLVLPTDKLSSYSRLLRLWISTDIRAILSVQGKPKYRVLFLLDEMAQLGRMDSLRDAVSIVRGYGATIWTILQDLFQIKALYPNDEWQPFVSSSKVQQYFGVADLETAKYVSEKLGKKTIEVESINEGQSRNYGQHGGNSTNQGITKTQQVRPLLHSDEIMRMNRNEQIIFIQGQDPILANKIEYFKEAYLQKIANSNPQHKSV
jgi:type IV secretion system protein VirD4